MPRLSLRRGDDFQARVTITDPAGDPVNLLTWTLEAEMKIGNCGRVELQAEWVDATQGIARVFLEDAETENLQIDDYELQVRAISPADVRTSSLPITVTVRE